MATVYTKLDRETFNSLYHSYRQVLYNRFLAILNSREVVEDIIQDVFVKVWLKREQVRMDGSLKAYMFKIGQNKIVDYYRNQNRQRRMVSVQLLFLESDSQKEESKLEKEERIIQMRKVINKLPPKRKKVFELCKFEEKSYEEVS